MADVNPEKTRRLEAIRSAFTTHPIPSSGSLRVECEEAIGHILAVKLGSRKSVIGTSSRDSQKKLKKVRPKRPGQVLDLSHSTLGPIDKYAPIREASSAPPAASREFWEYQIEQMAESIAKRLGDVEDLSSKIAAIEISVREKNTDGATIGVTMYVLR